MGIAQNQNQYQGWLEALRGVAILSVVIHHYCQAGLVAILGEAWTRWFNFGVFGVGVFFCISGYIITYSLRGRGREFVGTFVVRRIFRLYPAYIVAVVLAIVAYRPLLSDALLNFTMLQRFLGARDINGVFWTLQVEFIFYAISAGMLWFGGLRLRWTLATLLACCFSAIVCGVFREYLGVKAPSAVALGLTIIFLSAYVRQLGSFSGSSLAIVGGALAAMVTAIYLSYSKDWGYQENPERFLVSYLCAFCTFGCCAHFQPDFGRLLKVFGRLSYSLYLVHQPVASVISSAFDEHSDAVVIPVAFTISLILSYALYRFVEMPGHRLGHKLTHESQASRRDAA